MLDADGSRHYTTYVRASAAAVWGHVVDREAQAQWYLEPVDWDLVDGGSVSWGKAGQVFVAGRVVAFRPRARFLAHTFAFPFLADQPGLVRWRITQMGEVTQVWLRHELETRQATEGIVGGSWPVMLARLKTLVESGEPMPEPVWPAKEGWDADPA